MKSWKVFLSVGIIIFIIGVAVFISGFAAGGWKFGADMKMQTFTSEADDTSLDLSLAAGEMKVEFFDGEHIEVDYPSAYPYSYNVKESGGKLSVAPANNHIFFGVFNWFRTPTITVRIPQGKVMDLKLKVSAGKASVASGEFAAFNLSLSAGYVTVGNIRCSSFKTALSAGSASIDRVRCDDIKIDLSAGSASLTVEGKKSDYYITVDKSAGSCNVSGQQGAAAGKVIDIDLSAGSVNVGFTD